jgi:D-amino peptidase
MRVHISIDMEGVAGVADPSDTRPGESQYEYCRKLMTWECNAVIEGCFDAGATDVIVNDSHGSMTNLLQVEIDPRARVVRGWTKRFGMVQGLEDDVDATMFVGYHAAAGHADGVLNHTMNGRDIVGVYVNTEPAGELRLNAAMAGWLGVPVVLVSGDDVVCAEARACLGDIEVVEVKRAIDRFTAVSIHPSRAQSALRDAARRALSRLSNAQPYRVEIPATLRVNWSSTSIAALCENVPGVRRVSAREVQFRSNDYSEVYRLFIALGLLATVAPPHG